MKKLSIPSESISVVINGLVVGNSDADERERFTKRSLESVRKYLPNAQLILSSWEGSDISGLDYDDVVLSPQPVPIYITTTEGQTKLMSGNNQIVSSQNGLKLARRQYTLRMRSDTVLTGTNFLNYFVTYNRYPNNGILKKKVVVLPTFNPRRAGHGRFLFDTCDWLFFGLTEDIKNIYDVPFVKESDMRGVKTNGGYPAEENFSTEQYLWLNFLRKYEDVCFPSYSYNTPEALALSEKSYAENAIMVPAHKAGFLSLKMPHAAYGARSFLSQGLYTFNEYKKMYNRYNAHKIFYISNPFENLAYAITLRSRTLMKKAAPGLYKTIVNIVRKRNKSDDLLR